ncbi:ABC transporter substrate-binding protein [Myxococcota bacterium]|nr:ABC transporter substrate-binding protein [Myxococcota bacterium]
MNEVAVMSRIQHLARSIAPSVLAALLAGCSLVIDVEECTSTADCTGNLVCVDQICVPDEVLTDAGTPDAGSPDASAPDSGTTPDAGACTRAGCVAQNGEGWVCGRSDQCVQVLTANCPSAVGPIERDGTVIMGSIMPTTMGWDSLGRPIEQGMELAVQEINQTGGVTGSRQIAIVQCDDAGNATKGREVAQHLVDLGVPVIFGPAFSGIFIEVTTQVTAPAGVMTMSPSATSPLIAGIEDQGLGWRTAANDTFQAVALADLIRARGYRKIIALGKNDAYGNGLLNGVSNELSAELGASGLLTRNYPDPGQVANPDFAGVVAGALTGMPAPEAVVLLGTTETIEIMKIFEGQISTSTTTEYLFADGGRLDDMIQAIGEDPTLVDRVEGTEADHQSASGYDGYKRRFASLFDADPGIYGVNAYDAVYLAAYGLCTLPMTARATGTELAASMSKLVSGRAIPAGFADFATARGILAAGGSIDYDGASGPLDFDLTVGEAPANVALWQVRWIESPPPASYRFVAGGRYTITGGEGAWSFE